VEFAIANRRWSWNQCHHSGNRPHSHRKWTAGEYRVLLKMRLATPRAWEVDPGAPPLKSDPTVLQPPPDQSNRQPSCRFFSCLGVESGRLVFKNPLAFTRNVSRWLRRSLSLSNQSTHSSRADVTILSPPGCLLAKEVGLADKTILTLASDAPFPQCAVVVLPPRKSSPSPHMVRAYRLGG